MVRVQNQLQGTVSTVVAAGEGQVVIYMDGVPSVVEATQPFHEHVVAERVRPVDNMAPKVLWAAEYDRDACCLNWHWSPIFCICLPDSNMASDRQYAYIWDNKLEINIASSPFGCCTMTEKCVNDRISTIYFDKSPMRVGMCCLCIPAICCGPPVIFSKEPRCCCGLISLQKCYGVSVLGAPCNCFDCKTCICCGAPCYESCSTPMLTGLTKPGGRNFTAAFKNAMDAYKMRHSSITDAELAVFRDVKEGWLNDSTSKAGDSG